MNDSKETDWELENSSSDSGSIGGYSVLDAFGLQIGSVGGVLRNSGGEIGFVCVTAFRSNGKNGKHLLPVAYITHVNRSGRFIQLARLDRETFTDICPEFSDAPAAVAGFYPFSQIFGPAAESVARALRKV